MRVQLQRGGEVLASVTLDQGGRGVLLETLDTGGYEPRAFDPFALWLLHLSRRMT
jgi:hypothetical protein